MQLEIVTPTEYTGDILADLGRRRTKIENKEEKENNYYIEGKVPLKKILNYSTDLKKLTQGRGSYMMYFSHHEEVPQDDLEKILKEEKVGLK